MSARNGANVRRNAIGPYFRAPREGNNMRIASERREGKKNVTGFEGNLMLPPMILGAFTHPDFWVHVLLKWGRLDPWYERVFGPWD